MSNRERRKPPSQRRLSFPPSPEAVERYPAMEELRRYHAETGAPIVFTSSSPLAPEDMDTLREFFPDLVERHHGSEEPAR